MPVQCQTKLIAHWLPDLLHSQIVLHKRIFLIMNYSWSKTEHILRWSVDGMKGFGYFSYIFARIVK